MAKIFALILFCLSGAQVANAQTPANNLMPDGSRDLYIGLGAVSQARYEGSNDSRVLALPVLQMQWSNGIFVAGMSAGMHLSEQPGHEYGPLFSFEGGRSTSGNGAGVFCPRCDANSGFVGVAQNPGINGVGAKSNVNKLEGMDDVNPRVLIGAFYNVQLASKWRLTNHFGYGAGNSREGLRWNSDVRYSMSEFASQHHLTLSAGASFANQAYNQAYFGVTRAESLRSLNRRYTPSAGVIDIHAELHWNWALSASWLLTSALNVSRLNGSAAASPLVEKETGVTVSSALAYRF
jgi:outer membrane protein